MIYQEPALQSDDEKVLELIHGQRKQLRMYTQSNPRRWFGSLRRSTFARAIQGSNSIEGYNASIDQAIAAIEDEPPLDDRTETWFAVSGYRDALTYVMQAAQDPYFEFSKQFLKSLHFMMLNHDMNMHPGQWRPGSIFVVSGNTGKTVYEGPPSEEVDKLALELVEYLAADTNSSAIVRAAMAHLNLTMIHPFRDGNGRMARALQTLVLAREGLLHPVFSSIEEWLGRNTEEYYAVLAVTGEGKWSPKNNALPWVRFSLKAHYQQAATLVRRHEEYGTLFEQITALIARNKLHDRMAVPLFDTAQGMRLTNARYQTDAEVTQYIASRDLKRLSDIGLIEPKGEKRGRTYIAGIELREIRLRVRIKRPPADPYDLLLERADVDEPKLPGIWLG